MEPTRTVHPGDVLAGTNRVERMAPRVDARDRPVKRPAAIALAVVTTTASARAEHERRMAPPTDFVVALRGDLVWTTTTLAPGGALYHASTFAPGLEVGWAIGPLTSFAFGRLVFPSSTSLAFGMPHVDAYADYGLGLRWIQRSGRVLPWTSLYAGHHYASAAPIDPHGDPTVKPLLAAPVPEVRGPFFGVDFGAGWLAYDEGAIGPALGVEAGPLSSRAGRGSYEAIVVSLRWLSEL